MLDSVLVVRVLYFFSWIDVVSSINVIDGMWFKNYRA